MDTQVVTGDKYCKATDHKELPRPECEYGYGTCKRPATWILAWPLNGGRRWKLSCSDHADKFGGPNYLAAKLLGWMDNHDRPVHPIGTIEPD
jgi:hypothetical protein